MNKYFLLFALFTTTLLCAHSLAPEPYDEDLARKLVYLAGAVYCPNADFPNISMPINPPSQISWANVKALGYEFYDFAHATMTELKVFPAQIKIVVFKHATEKHFVVAFEGTDTKTELLVELYTRDLVPFDLYPNVNIMVDSFFISIYKDLFRDQLKTILARMKNEHPEYKVTFTGHSLGSSIATIAALDGVWGGYVDGNAVRIYTFGQPRTGNYEFAEAVNSRIRTLYRIVHYKDPVPHIPLCHDLNSFGDCIKSENITEYYHVNTEVFYPTEGMEKGSYKICQAEDDACSDQYALVSTSANDHLWYFGIRISCDQAAMDLHSLLKKLFRRESY